jgi:hypothetical protein
MIRLDKDLIMLNADGEQIPVYIEGDAPDIENLPQEYFTVSEDYTSNAVSADNKAQAHLYEFTLKWYTKDVTRLYTGLIEAIEQLISKGYDAEGIGYHNGTYQNTWFSRMVDIEKIENLED